MGMKLEHLKSWLREETREKDPDTKAWDKFVSITQVAFQDDTSQRKLRGQQWYLYRRVVEGTEA